MYVLCSTLETSAAKTKSTMLKQFWCMTLKPSPAIASNFVVFISSAIANPVEKGRWEQKPIAGREEKEKWSGRKKPIRKPYTQD